MEIIYYQILIITPIIIKFIDKNLHLLPKDIENSIVIHLRLGDVVAGTEWHEMLKRPLTINYLKDCISSIKDSYSNIYVIGNCFFASGFNTNNYNECVNLSTTYLTNVLNEFNAIHFDGKHADIDLCCAVKAKYFIQGRGFYGQLISKIRTKMNKSNYEIEPTS